MKLLIGSVLAIILCIDVQPTLSQCGTSNLLVTNDAQILAYPSDGFNYPNNQVCSWTLVSSNTFDLVEISFLSFDTELLHDTLTISENGIQRRQYSGSTLPTTYTSITNSVSLTFRSDHSITRSGFRLRYQNSGSTFSSNQIATLFASMVSVATIIAIAAI